MNIVLITGGPSAEREVSIATSKSILEALRESGHKVKVVDPVNGDNSVGENEVLSLKISKEFPSSEEIKEIQKTSNRNILKCFNSRIFDDTDIAFLGVHGKFGEDGRLQTLLELRGIKYTGSGVFSSAISMDKDLSKILCRTAGIDTPDWFSFTADEYRDSEKLSLRINNETGYPCVIKPNDEGSTVGLSIVQPDVEDIQLQKSVDLALRYSDKVIAEKYIKGRELTVAVLGNEALPVIEIIPDGGFYDYEHKYTKGMTQYICPAEIPVHIEKELKEKAVKLHKLFGCRVYSRIDFMFDEKSGKQYFLEINTLPGMTSTSLVPKSAAAAGMSFRNLIDKILELSLK
ncbi:MAG: D-alanine--D-alanine ligase B [Ignavibacteria bacterium]|nr:D-alanine--D-alanine ligase B [Ignavibacteria bacterium]